MQRIVRAKRSYTCVGFATAITPLSGTNNNTVSHTFGDFAAAITLFDVGAFTSNVNNCVVNADLPQLIRYLYVHKLYKYLRQFQAYIRETEKIRRVQISLIVFKK